MKIFTKNTLCNLALSALSAAVLSACGGAGSCTSCVSPTPAPGELTLSIAAPTQYPAGLPTPIEASLTMTNTSSVNASNLVYTIPAPNQVGNYTGVVITPNAGIGSQSGACTNIAAGASCTFTATIAAYANPGSFTVTATPNGSATQQAVKTVQVGKALQADSISVTANLGLVDIPNTNNEYYILPSDQTIQGSSSSATTAYVSVLVKAAGEGLNSLKLVDETGTDLPYVAIGTLSYTVNSVNSYKVTIPAGKSIQHIQALSNVCTTLNTGENNNSACSNDADVNLVSQGNGILSVQPSQFSMSDSYESQVITLTNTGTGTVNNIVYPDWASLGQGQFTLSENNCANLSKLSAGQSCNITLIYTANTTSSAVTPVFSYDDDNNSATEPKNTEIIIPYTGTLPATPFSILTVQPSSVSLSEASSRRVLTITNTAGGNTAGVTIPAGWTLPRLSAPLALESTNCYALSDGLHRPVTTKALSVGDSCIYTIKYSNAESAGQASLAFTYNNGIASGQITNVAVDWTRFMHQYIFVVGGTGGEGSSVMRCELDASNASVSSCNVTPENAPWFTPFYMAFVSLNNVDYAYVNDSSSIYMCTVTESKNLENCNLLTLNNVPKDPQYMAMSVTEVNGILYLYTGISNGISNSIYKCPINSDTSLGDCESVGFETTLYGQQESALNSIYSMEFVNLNSAKYIYITSGLEWTPQSSFPYPGWAGVLRCDVNSTGVLVNCTNFSSTQSIGTSYGLAFNSSGTDLYSYVGSYDSLYYCPVDVANGDIGSCTTTPFTHSTWEPNSINFEELLGIKYGYVVNSIDHTLEYCTVNSNGSFNSCNVTVPPEFPNWSPASTFLQKPIN